MHDAAGFIQQLAGLQLDGRQVGENPCIFLARQTGKNTVSEWNVFSEVVGQSVLLVSADAPCPRRAVDAQIVEAAH
jgi:hypothetical protein